MNNKFTSEHLKQVHLYIFMKNFTSGWVKRDLGQKKI